MDNSNIILIGFMGCGKTTIGRELAKLSGLNYVDTDILIQEQQNMDISEMWDKKGEEYFRNLETDICKGLQGYKNSVICTGGGPTGGRGSNRVEPYAACALDHHSKNAAP